MILITFIQVAWNIDGSERQRMHSAPWQQRARKFRKGLVNLLLVYIRNHSCVIHPDQNTLACQNMTKMLHC